MFKSRPTEFNQLAKLPKRSSFVHKEMDEWWTEEIFTDEYSDELLEDLNYEDNFFKSTSLTRQFRIILMNQMLTDYFMLLTI